MNYNVFRLTSRSGEKRIYCLKNPIFTAKPRKLKSENRKQFVLANHLTTSKYDYQIC